jgi:regulation of enolase protein 1 (concanavalin A-like superfamily)
VSITVSDSSSQLPAPWAYSDIWGTADAFGYLYQPMSGDGVIVARLASIQNTNAWAKAGVMIRESLAPDSRHAFMAMTPTNGAAFQRRPTTGGSSQNTSLSGIAAPRWVRLERSGNSFTGSVSADGSTWTVVGSVTMTMASTVHVGLAVTSHVAGTSCTSVFDGVALNGSGGPANQPPSATLTSPAANATFTAPATVAMAANASDPEGNLARVDFMSGSTVLGSDTTAPYSFSWTNVPAGTYILTARAVDGEGAATSSAPVSISVTDPASSLPAPWTNLDVGAVGVAGSAQVNSGVFTVLGSGADIWGATDAFHFVRRTWTGDGQIVARLATQQNTNGWAKAGVMIRESGDANSRHAMMVLTPSNGAAFQFRTGTGGWTTNVAGPALAAPALLRLVRSGSTITAYVSSNGTTWTQVGSASISLPATAEWGLAVTSHNNAVLGQATFDGVQVN